MELILGVIQIVRDISADVDWVKIGRNVGCCYVDENGPLEWRAPVAQSRARQ